MAEIVEDECGAAPEDVLRLEEIVKPPIAAREVLAGVRAGEDLSVLRELTPTVDRTFSLAEVP